MSNQPQTNEEVLDTQETIPPKEETTTETQNVETSEPKDELTEALEKVQSLELALEEALKKEQDILLRTRAEIDNIRRRAGVDVEKAHKFALEKFAKDLLETIDNLERALTVPSEQLNDTTKAVVDGVDLTLKGLLKTVEQYGIKAVGVEGEAFNPELHHAIKQEEKEGVEANTITTVLQKGYTLNDRVIRPAMVMIAA